MSNQILGKIISGYIIDEKGTKLNLGKISDVTFEQNTNYCDNLYCSIPISKSGTFTLEIEPDENGNLFTIEVPQEKEKGEKELNGSIVSCRFATAKGEFNKNTKIYDYYVNCKPEDCIIKEGTVFKIWNLYEKKVMYSGTSLRCENIVGVMDQRDAEDIVGKSLKVIERIEIAGETNISPNKTYINPLTLNKIESQILTGRLKENKSIDFVFGEPEKIISSGSLATNDNSIILKADKDAPISVMEFKDALWNDRDFIIDRTNIDTLGGNDMNTNMFGNMFKNMKFGKLETNDIKYSMKGIAFKTTDGDYVCYNPDFTFTNVANMVMDMPMFAMPVSKDQIKVGDVISHNDTWVIVSDVTPTEIKVARPWTKEIVSVIPETSIFGFSFYTKVMNPFENLGTTATTDNPFGNILPFMLMSGGDTKNSNDMLMMMLAFGGGKIDFSNPMMMYMLMGDKGNTNDMLMMMMLSGNNPFEQKRECKCSCKVGDTVYSPDFTVGADFDWTQFVPMSEIKIDVSAMDIENK